jgi:heme a synthase
LEGKHLSIHRLSFYTILLTYILIVFGGFVASTESGMGCGPEWPLCNGAVIPELSGETLIEFTHRLIGLILSILIVTLFLKIKRSKATTSETKAANWMISLLALQVSLGAIVVFLDLPIWIIIIHLFIAMAFVTTLLWIWRSSQLQLQSENTSPDKSNRKFVVKHINICLIFLLLTLGFGGYIKHQHSHGIDQEHHSSQQQEDYHHEQATIRGQENHHNQVNLHGINGPEYNEANSTFDWLFQWDSWIPLPSSGKEIIEATHLTLAIISSIYILVLTYFALSKEWESCIRNRLLVATAMVLSQVTVGLTMVFIDIPLFWAVLHLAIGTTLLINVIETRVFLSLSEASIAGEKKQTIA